RRVRRRLPALHRGLGHRRRASQGPRQPHRLRRDVPAVVRGGGRRPGAVVPRQLGSDAPEGRLDPDARAARRRGAAHPVAVRLDGSAGRMNDTTSSMNGDLGDGGPARADVSRAASGPRWLAGLVIGLDGLFYAYAVWNAIAHLVSMARDGLTPTGWVTLLFGVVFPALVFVLAYALGRRRNVGELALVMLAGLGVVAVFWLSL